MSKKPLFEIDVQGLAATSARRGRAHIMYELISNALDQNVRRVDVTVAAANRGLTCVRVEDDDPEGFSDLAHAWTIFGASPKRPDAEKRGRFDLGEKLVIAQCVAATIRTTKGTVEFDVRRGRRTESSARRECGSEFEGHLRITKSEREAMIAAARSVIVYNGNDTPELYVNGDRVPGRSPLEVVTATLPTEWWLDGAFHRGPRQTEVEIYKGSGWLYELGIPVCQTGDTYDVNIRQRVPLNIERDNVTPAYLRKVRVAVLNATSERLTPEVAATSWVRQALESPEVAIESVSAVIEATHGAKVAVNDPSAPETRYGAINRGYDVIAGRQYNKAQWENIRRLDLPSTSEVAPGKHDAKTPDRVLEDGDLTSAMVAVRNLAQTLALRTLGHPISIMFIEDRSIFPAMYGASTLTFNVAKLRSWFDGPLNSILDLLIHELGHDASTNHLDSAYHAALTKIAGATVALALSEPGLFLDFEEERRNR
jgi:hypothetical protein